MKNRPLIGVTLSFVSGILVVHFLTIHLLSVLLITITLSIILLSLLILHQRASALFILILTFLTGIIYSQYCSFSLPPNNISHIVKNDKLPVRLRGIVLTDPIIRHLHPPPLPTPFFQKEIATFLMKVEAAGDTPNTRTHGYKQEEKRPQIQWGNSPQQHWKKITGIVKVNVCPRIQSSSIFMEEDAFKTENQFLANFVKYGDSIELIGYISKPAASRNPSQFDYKTYLRRQRPRIDVIANLNSEKNIQLLSKKQGNYFFTFVYRLKRKLTTLIKRYVAEESLPLVCSILLGDREKVKHPLLEGFIKTGTMHFLAISGFHVGILVVSMHYFLRIFRMNTKQLAIIIIMFTFIYASLTGMKTPIVRASIMVATFYGAYVFHRRWDLPNSITAAALFILVINPSDLFNPGFQLSILAILGITCLSVRIENRLWKSAHLVEKLQSNDERNRTWSLFKKYFRKTFCASAAAWFAVTPLIAYHFNLVTPLALLLNIVVLPLIWCILVGGVLVLLMGIAVPMLAPLFGWIVSYSETALRGIIFIFSSNVSIFRYTAEPSWVWIFIYYVVATLFVLRKSFRLKFEHMVIAALFLLNIFVFTSLFRKKDDFLQLTCFDVKHGTAIFIQFPNGKNMLFDCGTWSNYDVGERIVAPFLWERKIKTIDTVVISHHHADHCNGIPSLIERFTVGNVFINKFLLQSGRKNELLKLIRKEKIKICLLANGLEIAGYEPAKITVLNPPDKDTAGHGSHVFHRLTANDASSVLLIEYLGYKIVLCADVGESGIKLFLSSMNRATNPTENFVADILQVPHHGGFIDNTEELIRRIRPKYAVVSGNRSIVSTSTMKAYLKSGAEVFKTYRDGAVSFTIGREGIAFSKFLND